jgi:hypothetical protein
VGNVAGSCLGGRPWEGLNPSAGDKLVPTDCASPNGMREYRLPVRSFDWQSPPNVHTSLAACRSIRIAVCPAKHASKARKLQDKGAGGGQAANRPGRTQGRSPSFHEWRPAPHFPKDSVLHYAPPDLSDITRTWRKHLAATMLMFGEHRHHGLERHCRCARLAISGLAS